MNIYDALFLLIATAPFFIEEIYISRLYTGKNNWKEICVIYTIIN